MALLCLAARARGTCILQLSARTLLAIPIVVRKTPTYAASLVGLALFALPALAHAEDIDDAPLMVEADVRYLYVARPPSLDIYTPGRDGTQVDGLGDGFGRPSGALQGAGVHLGITYRPARHLLIPTLGITGAAAGGAYASIAREDGVSFDPSSVGYMLSLDLIGFGVDTRKGPFYASATVRAGVDYFYFGGRLSDPQISEDVVGRAIVFTVRAEARVCMRLHDDGTGRVCMFGGPTLIEGSTTMNGAVAGFGATF